MRIKFNDLTDEISYRLYKGYGIGANWRKNNSQPCTLCRKAKKEGVMDGIRIHFHGSEFGQCMWKTYNNMLGSVNEEIIKGYSAAGLSDGHAHEKEIFTNLEFGKLQVVPFGNQDQNQKEIKVYYKKPKKGDNGKGPYDFRFAKDGELKGDDKKEFAHVFNMILHLDGLYVHTDEDGEKVYGVECKSVKDYTYKKIAKTSEISDVWYGQVQAYMAWAMFAKADTFYLIVKSRHSSDIYRPIRIERDDKYINRRLNVLYRIHRAIIEDDPEKYEIKKEHETKGASECRFCDYKEGCWGSK